MPSDVSLVLGVAAASFAFTGGNVTTNDTVAIGDITYTFKATPAAAYDIDVGTDLDTSITNLAAAINASGTAGLTSYYTGTLVNPYVSATADTSGDTLGLTARWPGAWVNGIRLASSAPGANDITAAATVFSGVSGGTDGAGHIPSWADGILNLSQVNSDVQRELKKLTEAAD